MATKTIGVREFRDHASDVLRKVEVAGQAYDITRRGRVVARLVPAEEQDLDGQFEEWFRRWRKLGKEISAHWQGPADAVAAIREQRRDL